MGGGVSGVFGGGGIVLVWWIWWGRCGLKMTGREIGAHDERRRKGKGRRRMRKKSGEVF